jgi:uncharacterized protein
LSDRFVKDPREVVKAGQVVKVKVLEVDLPRKRIALTMRLDDPIGEARAERGQRPDPRTSANVQKQIARQQAPAPANALAEALLRAKRN